MIFGAKPYGNIITDGLVLNLDATNPRSYPGTGTTWFDTSGNTTNGTLTNGPVYLQERGRGSFIFDSSNDYVALPNGAITGSITMLFWIKGDYQNYALSLYERNSNTGIGLSAVRIPNNGWVQVGYIGVSGSTNQFVINGQAYSGDAGAGFPYDNATYRPIIWIAGIPYFGGNSNPNLSFHLQPGPGGVGTGFSWIYNFPYRAIGVTATAGNQRYFSGSISVTQIYNRALSAQEVLQNYNALKSRFV